MPTMLISKNGRAIRQYASKEEMIAAELRPTPTAVGRPTVNIGAVAEMPNETGQLPMLTDFSVELDNSAGLTDASYIIGDPTGLVALQNGGTLLNPDGCSADGAVKGSGVLAMKKMFGFRPVAVRSFNYQVSSDPAQFSRKLRSLTADIQGGFSRVPNNVAIQRRNNQFDENLMTLDLVIPFVFTPFSALTLVVMAGETVNLEFSTYMVA